MRPLRYTLGRRMQWAVVGLLLACFAHSAAASDFAEPRVGDAVWERWQELSDELAETRSTPLGLIALEELELLTRWVPYPAMAAAVAPVLEDEESDFLVRASAAHRLARAYLSSGDLEASQGVIDAEGYLTRWSIIGPFPNEGMAGFERAFGPEAGRDPEAVETGRAGEVGWRNVDGLSRNGYLDLARLAPPSRSAVVYAVTQVEVARTMPAQLWTAVDGAYKIWLNGEPVAAMDADLGGGPIREWWDVRLERGSNEVVVKVAGENGDLGFYLRLTDRDGDPLSDWSMGAELVANDQPLAAIDLTTRTPSGSVLSTLDDLFFDDLEVIDRQRDESLTGAALVLKRAQSRDPAEPWRGYLTERSCLEGSPRALARCAQVQDHYWERNRTLTLALAELAEDDPFRNWVELALATLAYDGVGDSSSDEVRDFSDSILARRPDFVPAILLQARLWGDAGQPWRAQARVSAALELAPDSPEVLYEALWGLRQGGDTPALLEIERRMLEMSWDNPTNVLSLSPALASAGRRGEALELIDLALAVQPLSLALYRVQANLLFSGGDEAGAESSLRRAIANSPHNVRAWEELGRLSMRVGNIEAAVEAFDHALAIEPQNQELALLRRQLGSEEDPFYTEYLLSLEELREAALPAETVGDRDWYTLAQQQITQVHANGLGTEFVQEAYQIQTRSGADALRQYQIDFIPDDEVVEILVARIIKPDGTVSESFQRWEQSLSQPWYGLYYDFRALMLGFEDLAPGDILEVAYTLSGTSRENMLDDYFGDFYYVQGFQPKGLVRYGVVHPPDLELFVRPPVLAHEAVTREAPNGVHEMFVLEDVPRIEWEAMMPGRSEVADHIHISTFEHWSDVGDWYWNLIHDQLVTSPEIESTVASLIEGLDTTYDRVRAIHEYVVRNTRYVGLEFGIHGFRPYRTTVSFARRFGDCKDTASLIKVMLAIAGIDSRIVVLRTRDNGTIEEYPPSLAVFNHVITYVPDLDLFLDGTAGHAGVDELPYGDQGASALIVDEDGEHRFIHIPTLSTADSRLEHSFDVDLSAPGAPARAEIVATGQFAPPMRRRYEAEENRLEDFQRDFAAEYPGARIGQIEFTGLADINEPTAMSFDFEGVTWLRGAEGRWLLLPLGVEADLSARLAGVASRAQPLELEFPFQNHYRLELRLPPDLVMAADVQRSHQQESPFGHFAMSLEQSDDRLRVEVSLEISALEVSASDYPAFREFIQHIEQAINRQIVLVRRSDG